MAKKHTEHQKHEHEVAHKTEHHQLYLEPKRIGIAFGVLKSLGLGFLALLASTLGWGSALVRTLSSVFLGYEANLLGIFLGFVWGFACGFVAGYVFALVYNKVDKCCCC